jgi:hypothetical protein
VRETALHLAAVQGNEAVVRLLVEKGADVEAMDNDGKTMLHLAAVQGNEAVVRLLVDKGAEVTAMDNGGRTALHLAAVQGNEAVVRLPFDKQNDMQTRKPEMQELPEDEEDGGARQISAIGKVEEQSYLPEAVRISTQSVIQQVEFKMGAQETSNVPSSFQQNLMEFVERSAKSGVKDNGFHSRSDLRCIAAELLDTNPSRIEWTDGDKVSWGDIFKHKFEDWTKEKWNWWPFNPLRRALLSDEARLYWTCVSNKSLVHPRKIVITPDMSQECGQKRWAEVPVDFAKAMTQSTSAYLSGNKLVAYSTSSQPSGVVHSQQSPSSSNTPSGKIAQNSPVGSLAGSASGLPRSKSRPELGSDSNTTVISSSLPAQYIFFLVAAGSDFRLAQIRVGNITTYGFFRELRQQYDKLRPFCRKWLSIWVYSHCDFYRVRASP